MHFKSPIRLGGARGGHGEPPLQVPRNLSRTPLGEDRRYDLGVLVASRVNNPELFGRTAWPAVADGLLLTSRDVPVRTAWPFPGMIAIS
jgi:hypothetical protein